MSQEERKLDRLKMHSEGAANEAPTCAVLIFNFNVLPPPSSRANYSRNGSRWCAVIRKPGSAWLEGTPAMDLGHMNVV